MNDRPRLASVICCTLIFGPVNASAGHRDTWIEIQSPHFTVLSNGGEYAGRTTASQFEEIRALFLHLYPAQHVDSGKPTIVFAVKNEDSLKLFVPDYGQNNKSMRLGGFYRPTYDKNFAIVRTDVRATEPLGYRTLYHEYTHAFLRYNYRGLPVWLEEGLAEFYGNTNITSQEAGVGLPNAVQLRLLKENGFVPIDQLVTIDRIRTLHATDDPIEAAKETFGDPQKLSEKLKGYIQRFTFSYLRGQVQPHSTAHE